jgi:hypothetical protein
VVEEGINSPELSSKQGGSNVRCNIGILIGCVSNGCAAGDTQTREHDISTEGATGAICVVLAFNPGVYTLAGIIVAPGHHCVTNLEIEAVLSQRTSIPLL